MGWVEFLFGVGDVQMAILPILAIAGLAVAGAGAAGQIGARNRQDRRLADMRAGVQAEQAENKRWYNTNYLSDYTQRADAQLLFKNLRDNLKRSRDVTSATAAVTGATPAAVAAAKERDARAVSDTYGSVAAVGQQWKDRLTDQYLRRKDFLSSKMYGLDQAGLANDDRRAQDWGSLMQSGLNAASGAFMPSYAGMVPTAGKGKGGRVMPSGRIAGSYGIYYPNG
jgi:hypothetical protein